MDGPHLLTNTAVLDLAAVLFTSEPLRTFGFENLTHILFSCHLTFI